VQRIDEGRSVPEVADFLGVTPSSVRRWVAARRRPGADTLAARPVAGVHPKLTSTQEEIVRRWLGDNPTEHGFATELWTAPRPAQLIEHEFGVHFHPNYLPAGSAAAASRRRGPGGRPASAMTTNPQPTHRKPLLYGISPLLSRRSPSVSGFLQSGWTGSPGRRRSQAPVLAARTRSPGCLP
jgi:transposase